VVILVLVLGGKTLETVSKGRTSQAICDCAASRSRSGRNAQGADGGGGSAVPAGANGFSTRTLP